MKSKKNAAKVRPKKVDKTAFGSLLVKAITSNFPGQSWASVAEQIGISRGRFHRWTSGQALPNADTLPSVLEHFGITFDEYANLPRL